MTEHVQFNGVKLTTYTPEDTPDLVDRHAQSPRSIWRRGSSLRQERTTITRADFTIAGDSHAF